MLPANTTTRRAMLAGIAAAPTLGTAAFATPQPDDPIFAAIERHQKLCERERTLCQARDELWETLPESVTADPSVSLYPQREGRATILDESEHHQTMRHEWLGLTGKCYQARSLADIKKNATEIPEEHREAWIANREQEWQRRQREIVKARRAAGYTQLDRQARQAMNAQYDAGQQLISTKPTTMAGVLALVAYDVAKRNGENSGLMPDEDDQYVLLETIQGAIRQAVQS